MAYKYTKRELAQLALEAAHLANHFAVGNVIRSNYWGSHDRVVEFIPATEEHGMLWCVSVHG